MTEPLAESESRPSIEQFGVEAASRKSSKVTKHWHSLMTEVCPSMFSAWMMPSG